MVRPINEFNVSALLPQALQLRLAAAVAYGSEAIVNAFTQAADRSGQSERGRELKEAERKTMALTQTALQERLVEFQKKLDVMQRDSYEALIKSEERLRGARKELERLRERAHEVDLPDGRKMKVYRDGDMVRDDDDNIVDPSIIRADEIDDSRPTYAERLREQNWVEERAQDHEQRSKHYNSIEAAQERLKDGGLTPDDFADLQESVQPVARPSQTPQPDARTMTARQDASAPAPM